MSYSISTPCKGTSFRLNHVRDTPMIGGVACGTAACIDDQFYPASVIQDPQTGLFVAMAKSAGKIWAYTSPNGRADWKLHGTPIVVNEIGTLTEGKLETNILRYDPKTGLYHLYYGANDAPSAPYVKQLFHATATDVLGPYTTAANSPVISTSDMPSGYDWCDIGDMKVLPDGTHLYYVTLYQQGFTDWKLATFTSPEGDWENLSFDRYISNISTTYLNSVSLHPGGSKVVQKVTVTRRNGLYYMFFNVGHDSSLQNQRRIYAAWSEDPYNFKVLEGHVVDAGAAGKPNSMRVYNPELLLRQDGGYWDMQPVAGRYYLYYSGVDVGEINNTGQTYRLSFRHMPCVQYMPEAVPPIV